MNLSTLAANNMRDSTNFKFSASCYFLIVDQSTSFFVETKWPEDLKLSH